LYFVGFVGRQDFQKPYNLYNPNKNYKAYKNYKALFFG
jgi:hypothetical protein